MSGVKFNIITIFPEFFKSFIEFSIIKRAISQGRIEIEIYDLRKWSTDKSKHNKIDERPFGGGPGMIFMIEPMYRALKEIKSKNKDAKVCIPTPTGKLLRQELVKSFSYEIRNLIIIVPHYEGYDARIRKFIDFEFSIGNYVLTGGELPTMVLIDSITRLRPNVLGNMNSAANDSFFEMKKEDIFKTLEYPQYTKPEVFIDDENREHRVPKVLLSGNHKEIELWRNKNSKIIPKDF